MISTPGYKSPVSPVPETTQEENDKRVADNLRFRASAATQGDIDIIPEPGRQRNMPTTPEFSDIPAEIRDVEVPHQLDAEQFGRAYGNVGIAGEVPVNLEGEENRGKQQRAPALCLIG